METLIIQYNQSIKEKLMKILNTFSKSELEIVESSEEFEKLKREVQEDYAYMVSEDAEFLNYEEAKEELGKLRLK
ncbi:MAG TPA: hypothetical protein PKC37_03370 [Kaistella sp.]|jgi:hypothetical protein|nr:hypothetical protein [Flavobacteriales bacterium]MCA0391885.1 hypothetical protein [Bacteroidota bacterium]HMU06923.1 hypothetical protein [Kaistella sp.]HOB24070.1 hypothetical protein [Kaistella sp.]HPZ24456.1 hypothetical protein [Kaistella sp.]